MAVTDSLSILCRERPKAKGVNTSLIDLSISTAAMSLHEPSSDPFGPSAAFPVSEPSQSANSASAAPSASNADYNPFADMADFGHRYGRGDTTVRRYLSPLFSMLLPCI